MAFQRHFLKKALGEANPRFKFICHSSRLTPPELPPFDYKPKPYNGPLADEVEKRRKVSGPSLFHYYQKPYIYALGSCLRPSSAHVDVKQLGAIASCYKSLFSFPEFSNGRRYLDAFAGIVTVSCGHCHPDVLNAIMEQSKLLQHATTIYLHHAIADFAEALASKCLET
ncbi:hypothetical protein FNV43_RR18464 [Rhamnella rubrinervis]|uniref:alanine--glyoxylate transaminase n=1 Tax=Rhamnella rubrinervis TaxID=2594499 RepID=A0A8K0GY26_9ROSA|nr:hypothetical protein FNV43_RR18464 [Rhamnella rubrinervis]